MAQASLAVLKKNVTNCAVGFAGFVANSREAWATWKKIKDRQWANAPVSVREQKEIWEQSYWTSNLCQRENMWVDKELYKDVSQAECAALSRYKQDEWRMGHWLFATFCTGGWALPLWFFWFGNNSWVPSTFNISAQQKAEWREAQDLLRYKFVPAYLAETRWFSEYHIKIDQHGDALDNLFEKNDVRREQISGIRELAKFYETKLPFFRCRRKNIRAMCRAMGIPTFPSVRLVTMQTRVRDYWELVWNEDYMVVKNKLCETMTDDQLYDYAWRRFLAPYDKHLSRAQVMERVNDYHELLGKDFLEEGYTPNINIVACYCLGYYSEPAFLDADFSELEGNDFAHLASWGKDAFLKRLEFENGPLRDQVEAHSVKKLAERRKMLQAP